MAVDIDSKTYTRDDSSSSNRSERKMDKKDSLLQRDQLSEQRADNTGEDGLLGNSPVDVGEVSSFNVSTPKKNSSTKKQSKEGRSSNQKSSSTTANAKENGTLKVEGAASGAPAGYKKSLKLGTFSGQKSRRSNPSSEKKE